MKVESLKATRRDKIGSRHCREIRAKGELPGVIYGHGQPPEHVAFSAHAFSMHLQHGARVLHVDVDGKQGDYLIKDVQYDYLDKDPIHVDFARVDLSEKVQVDVGIELKGTPKGASEGGLLDLLLDTITVECKASDIPDTITVVVTELGLNEDISVGGLDLPEGVSLVTDADEKIAICREVGEAPEVEEAEEGAEAAEPEVIGRKAEEESSD